MFGTVNSVHTDKGFGFVRPDGYTKNIFFHISNARAVEFDTNLIGKRIEFDTTEDNQGRVKAINVRPAAA